MQSADQVTIDLHSKVSDSLTKHGIPTTPQQVNPEPDTHLQNIKGLVEDATHIVGTAGTILGGEEPSTYDRTTTSKSGWRKFVDRLKGKGKWK